MAFHETWTRYNSQSTEMEYGVISTDPRQLNDWELAARLGLGWIKKLTVTRSDDAINIYAGKRHWAIVYPSGQG